MARCRTSRRGPLLPAAFRTVVSAVLVAFLLFMMRSTSAFQVRTGGDRARGATQRQRRRIGTTRLTATSLPHPPKRRHQEGRQQPYGGSDDDPPATTTAGSVAKPPRNTLAARDWASLPLRRDEIVRRGRELDRMELVVGRIAMVGATSFLIQELVTGESILEQVAELFTKTT